MQSPFFTADSLRDEGSFIKALPLYRQLRDSFAVVNDTANLWRAQLWWSDTFRRLNQSDSARAGLAQAMRLSTGDRNRVGWTRLMWSFALERDGQLDSAFAEAVGALDLARATKDLKLEAYAHDALGTAHSLRGRYREALAADSTSLAMRRALGLSPATIAQSLNEVGIGYRHLGRYTDAVRVYEEALAIHRRRNHELGMAIVLHNLANIRTATGEVEQAAELLHESLRYSERLQNHRGMGFNHNALATLYLRAGNRSAARRHVESGLRINRTKGLKYGEVVALENLGRLELAEARPSPAEAALRAALSLADSAGFGRERVSIRGALVSAAIARKSVAEALRWARAATAIADSLGDPAAQFQALESEGAALEAARRGAALDIYLRAIDLLESWRGRLALGDLRMGVAEPRLSVYEGAIRLLLARKRPADAFEIAERARARLLLELMADRDGREARSREQALQARLRERYEARGEVKDEESRTRLDREIGDITAELTRRSSEAQAHDSSGRGGRLRPYRAAELQQNLMMNSNRALLAYFWGDSVVYGWWLTRDSVRAARLGSGDSLTTLIGFLRTAIERPSHDSLWRGVARRAYEHLVAPLAPGLVQHLLVVPDGPLAHVPIEVMIPARDAPPWGATARFTYGPSATVLLTLLQGPKAGGWERTMLALGNPGRGAGGLGEPAERGATATDISVALPYAETEARAIHKLFRQRGADLLLGTRATPARWLALDPSRYRYLHFAAHARVSDRRPEDTHLVLSDGKLDLAGIRRLRLRADLVTLSSCETALGRRVRGEGVIGLSHAFLAAGARATLVTLWRITDQSAADFMKDFYQELHAGVSPAEALRVVRQKWITGSGPSAHPSRWAPFVLVGESRSEAGQRGSKQGVTLTERSDGGGRSSENMR
ncbi:MAG: CHAT domain-containing tetratricopeptide repeat protein [Gemmatimonadales bacterium]